jgi:dual specificity phosphatase 3
MGVNRGPSAGYAVLLALGWDSVEALEAIRRARPIAYVAYAEDALSWHHERTGADAPTRERDLGGVRRWREQNNLDLLGVIRRIRQHEAL